MAIYGVSFYGSDLYGEAVISLLSVEPMRAESRRVGQVHLNWAALGGNWSEFRLLRNGYGHAVNEEDGDIILSFFDPSYQSSFVDTGLAANRFYYYTVFVYDLDTNQWVRAGQTQALTLKDYGTDDQMLRNLPQFYFDQDDSLRTVSQEEGPLVRFLRVFGLAHDLIRGEIESLTRIRDADRVSGGLLPFFADDLGVTYEPEIGMRQMRIWLRNAVYLYKIKGTRLGIEGVATALTGWGADASAVGDAITIDFQANRVNLIPNPSFEVDVTGWGVVGATATREEVDPASGTASVRLTNDGVAGPMTYREQSGIAVEEGRSYTFSAGVRDISANSSGARVAIEWLDATSAVIETSQGSAISIEVGNYVRPAVTAPAPVGASSARLLITIEDADATGEARVDAALFEEGADVRDYFDASFLGGDYIWEGTAHASSSHYYFNRAIKNARLDEVMEEYAPLGTTWSFTYAQP